MSRFFFIAPICILLVSKLLFLYFIMVINRTTANTTTNSVVKLVLLKSKFDSINRIPDKEVNTNPRPKDNDTFSRKELFLTIAEEIRNPIKKM